MAEKRGRKRGEEEEERRRGKTFPPSPFKCLGKLAGRGGGRGGWEKEARQVVFSGVGDARM